MAEKTNTVGFFNGHKFPIHLSISALNLTLRLEPGEFIVDRQQRKINDPYLERYTGKNQLSKEVSSKPVPVLEIPRFNATRPNVGESSVREVTEFVQDGNKVRRPVLPSPPTGPAPDENASSFKAMSMDEARRLGYVHKTREVPEDFGAPETQNGVPGGRIPEIKYATDLASSGKKTALPKTVVQPDLKAAAKAAVKSLSAPKSVVPQPPPPRSAVSAKSAVAARPASAVAKSSVAAKPTQARRIAESVPQPGSPFGNKIVSDLPAPVLEEAPDEEAPAEAEETAETEAEVQAGEELIEEIPPREGDEQADESSGDQESLSDEAEEGADGGQPMEPSFVCLKDGKVFSSRAELVAHIKANYPRQLKALMSAYPE